MQETEKEQSNGPRDTRDKSDQTTWNALDSDQKIERMRGILKDLQHTVEWHSRRFQELSEQISALNEHAHTDGKVMIPIKSKRRGTVGEGECQKAKVQGWF